MVTLSDDPNISREDQLHELLDDHEETETCIGVRDHVLPTPTPF
jgi:hypothetical protein